MISGWMITIHQPENSRKSYGWGWFTIHHHSSDVERFLFSSSRSVGIVTNITGCRHEKKNIRPTCEVSAQVFACLSFSWPCQVGVWNRIDLVVIQWGYSKTVKRTIWISRSVSIDSYSIDLISMNIGNYNEDVFENEIPQNVSLNGKKQW